MTEKVDTRRHRVAGWIGAGAVWGLALLPTSGLMAADHIEATATKNDVPADITDVYAWHVSSQNKLVVIVNFDGLHAPAEGQKGTFDDDVLYGVHIDNSGDHVADIDVWVRFGQDSLGNWGMQVENLPGSAAPVVGPVESIIYTTAGRYVFAGLRDDPFFFDLDGFKETLATGSVSFDSTNDSFAGTNVTSIVLEMDLALALQGKSSLQLWATTGRRN